MYKIKIINYQPYEYELFQKTLDKLGQEGFSCQDLSFISLFKKVKQPVYYKIDFYKSEGKFLELLYRKRLSTYLF